MPVKNADGELLLYGFVGETYWGDGFTALEVQEALTEHGRSNDVTIRVNSGGGYVDDGIAIFNALTAHKGRVTIFVDAIAASAASVIAMAGDEIVMRTGSMMMIHDPSGFAFGTAEDHEKSSELLDKQADEMAGIYADRSGQDAESVRAAMKETTWMTGEEAVDLGYADRTDTARSKSAAAFDYSLFAGAPEKLVALATRKGWSFEKHGQHQAATAATPRQSKEISMADKKPAADNNTATTDTAKAEGASEAKARIKAIMTSPEAVGREGLAQHLAYDTETSADDAEKVLAAAPKSSADASPPEPADTPEKYENNRLAAASQASPEQGRNVSQDGGGSQRKLLRPSAIYDARRKALKEG